jgi:2-polyprenyl-3-methyl-5-hydroxy-6-metoxy-1,4-benzoquinol methylase
MGCRGPRQARRVEDFDALYAAGTPAWDIGRPQSAFRALSDIGRLAGNVLDVGCGTGEHALMATASGLDATGLDASATAIDIARRKAEKRVWGSITSARHVWGGTVRRRDGIR